MYDKNHYNIVISLQLIKINEKFKKKGTFGAEGFCFQSYSVFCLQSYWYSKCGSGVYPMRVRSALTGLKNSRSTTALLQSHDVGGHMAWVSGKPGSIGVALLCVWRTAQETSSVVLATWKDLYLRLLLNSRNWNSGTGVPELLVQFFPCLPALVGIKAS